MSRKVFTAGEVLAAADVNSFLMDQTVMSFAGTAARGSAIPSPVEGMYTHLEDTDDLQFWNGSAWRSPGGLTRIVNQDFSGVTSVAIDNVFTSQYENYRVILRADTNTFSTNRSMFFQFRKAGSTITATNYFYGLHFVDFGSTTSAQFDKGASVSQWNILQYSQTSTSSYASLDIYSPQVSTRQTSMTLLNQSNYSDSGRVAIFGGGAYGANDTFDGFLLSGAAGNFTGNVKVYGYRN